MAMNQTKASGHGLTLVTGTSHRPLTRHQAEALRRIRHSDGDTDTTTD